VRKEIGVFKIFAFDSSGTLVLAQLCLILSLVYVKTLGLQVGLGTPNFQGRGCSAAALHQGTRGSQKSALSGLSAAQCAHARWEGLARAPGCWLPAPVLRVGLGALTWAHQAPEPVCLQRCWASGVPCAGELPAHATALASMQGWQFTHPHVQLRFPWCSACPRLPGMFTRECTLARLHA
jgi:hypothetical protein